MSIYFRSLFFVFIILAIGCSSDGEPQGSEDGFAYRDGIDFHSLPQPIATEDPSKIELVEAFWYGCIHCYNFEPYLKEYAAELPEYVDLVKVPVAWNDYAELHAKIYYAAEVLGITDEIHDEVFSAMNRDKKTLANEQAVLNLIEDLGQNRTAFQRAFNSFGVGAQISQSKARITAAGVRGTPELIVNGKYRVGSSAGSQQRMLEVANALIERERELLSSQQ
ncbi:MAG: thiol:disulfide interchange protein DsbA/DsbL [Porticoccaceae bacterium]|jgi:protein dithiol oxidoreductase (disulfide-forming)|nr:thiol:disulfide interchange protein DsbA/DsbL [Porticoccaceae bacterium]